MSRKARFNNQRSYGQEFSKNDSETYIRRVISQNNQGRINKNSSKLWTNVRDRLGGYDDDVDMQRNQQSHHQHRGTHRGPRGGGRSRGGSNFSYKFLNRGGDSWYQVRILFGARYTHDVILGKLVEHLGQQKFFPMCYHILGDDSAFYVDKFQEAQLLLSCTRKISLNDGSLMIVKIKPARPPFPTIDDALKEKIKTVMAKRYIADNKALDLTRFARDPEFIDGVYCPLGRPSILAAAIKIINDNIPDLHALKLTGNHISEFELASTEIKNLKSLRVLHVSENNISNMFQLDCFKQLGITELLIEKNPIVNKFSDKACFVRYGSRGVTEIRKRFPKLTKLDNVELAPAIAFDIGDEIKLPPPQAAFVCHVEGRDFVKVFLSQYFQIYDSDNKSDLAQAYDENAKFSMSVPKSFPPGPRLNMYITDSRNLLRINHYNHRRNLLKRGRSAIVDFLSRFPRTEHDLLSFAVDLTLFTPVLINLSVTGLFREKGSGSPSNWPLRHFSRTFLIVPVGTGFCIVNDILFITNASEEQIEVAFKTEPPKPAIAPSSAASSPVASALDPSIQIQMVQAVAAQTGMNMDWSRKCLEETSWDYHRALSTFEELQKRGVVPPEAFVKSGVV